ncbi:MAG: TolC family protein [Candidatus Omnitrophota bacterium]
MIQCLRIRFSWLMAFFMMGAFAWPQTDHGNIAPTSESPSSAHHPTIADPTPPLEDFIREALANNPDLAALQQRILAARERISPEGALPDPMVEFMVQDIGFPDYTIGDEEMSMAGVQIKQGLLYPGKLKSRKAAAEAEARIPVAQWLDAKNNLILQMRVAYAQLYALDYEQKSLAMGKELLEMLSATVASRYSAGTAEQEAVIKIQLQLSRIKEREIDLAAERKTVSAYINRLRDRRDDPMLPEIAILPEPPVAAFDSPDIALKSAPNIHIRQAELEAAKRKLEVARSELNPNFTVGIGAFSRGGFDEVVTFQVDVEFPLWKKWKQSPSLRAAERDLQQAEWELRGAEAMIRSEIVRLRAEWNKSQEQILLYREGILLQTSAALDAARASYLTGGGDFSTVVEDFNMWLDARMELARREAERFKTWAELDALLSQSQENGESNS